MSESATDYRAAYEDGLDGPAWLDGTREAAFEHFKHRGFPGPREEDWKYTRTAPIERARFSPSSPAALPKRADELLDLGGPRLVFVDGHLDPSLSSNQALGGISVLGLRQMLTCAPERLAPHLNQYADPHRHAFTALNTALSRDGAVVFVEPETSVDAPIHLVFAARGESDAMMHPRVLIVLERGSKATVLEQYIALADSRYFNNTLTEVSLADSATLTHYKLQRESTKSFHISSLDVAQHSHSRFESHSVSLGAALARHDINVRLSAPGAECTLNGLYMASGRQHVDYHTRIDHLAPHCTSAEDYKGVLGGRARGVFNGRVLVHKDAQKTDASQSNRNLLLSADAEIDTKPQLEIHADDVKCAHGATVGQLDQRMVFYLRSRGLDEAKARALLTYGFARDIVDRIDIDALREIVADALLDELPHAGELRSMLT